MSDLEDYKDIIGYDGKYKINKKGDVLNVKKNKLLKKSLNRGYYRVKLFDEEKKPKDYLLHRLLGIHFISNPDNKPIIDHINRNKGDNDLNNLRWVSYEENSKNRTPLKNKINGVKYVGVRFIKNVIKKPYRAETKIDKKYYHIGYYNTEEEAYENYKKFNKEKGYEIID